VQFAKVEAKRLVPVVSVILNDHPAFCVLRKDQQPPGITPEQAAVMADAGTTAAHAIRNIGKVRLARGSLSSP
jgi:hypothetical protein